MKRNELAGQRFHRLLVVSGEGRTRKGGVLWRCACECGGEAFATASDLRLGKVKSCGCLVKRPPPRGHGRSHTPTYDVWASMVQRCTNPNDRNWEHYGGRGISVCPEWMSFARFWRDMGDKPEGRSLERKQNDTGYSKGNCTWATRREQARNRRNNVWIDVGGVRMVLTDWCQSLGVSKQSVYYWIKKGLTHEEAILRIRRRRKE